MPQFFFLFSLSWQTGWICMYQVYIAYYAGMCDITFEAVASTCHILYQAQCQTSMSWKFQKDQNSGRRFWFVTDLCLCMKQNKQEHINEQINSRFLSSTTSEVIGPLLLLCWWAEQVESILEVTLSCEGRGVTHWVIPTTISSSFSSPGIKVGVLIVVVLQLLAHFLKIELIKH